MDEVEVTSQVNGWGVINRSNLPDTVISGDAGMKEIASKLSSWVDNARSARGRTTMFDRGTYTPPDNFYEEVRVARLAREYDDVVSGVAEITESFAFQGVKWEGTQADDVDVFNQMARDVNLDSYVRKCWQEEYTASQSVTAMLWGWKEYTVRGVTIGTKEDGSPLKGAKRKKKYRVWAPVMMRVLDSCKIVPVGYGPLGSEMLAWSSTNNEVDYWGRVKRGEVADPVMAQFFVGLYTPDDQERQDLIKLGVDVDNLLLLNPEMVFRHTLTKPDYERHPYVRMKSVFGLLDLKRQLIASDRATLVGSANYILLIRKGDKDRPGSNEEIANLQENYNFIAKMPVVISDHRLNIDIIAPKTDFTLQSEKYDVLDSRLLARLLGTLAISGRGQRNETNVTLSQAVAKGMENRRHMLRRSIETSYARMIIEHPLNELIRNRGDFNEIPSLVYTPRNIALGTDAAIVQALISLRTQREISRETTLELFGLDQSTEAQRMHLEEMVYDEIFKTRIPFAAEPGGGGKNPEDPEDPEPSEPPQVSGRRGGRPAGGGAPAQSPKAQIKPRTPKGNPSTGRS